MPRLHQSFRKVIPFAVSVAILSAGLTISSEANAWYHGGPGYWPHPYHHYGYGFEFGGAALAGGLVLGALAANAAAAAATPPPPPPPPPVPPGCRMVPKPMTDPYGNKYFLPTKVCG